MKNFAVLVVAALLTSSSALAAFNGPVLVKSSGSGFTPPQWSASETCEVFSNKVVITRHYASGELIVKETRAIATSGSANLMAFAEKAAAEPVESTENFLCDGPSTGIYINRILPNDGVEQVPLFSTGGCGSPRKVRQGPYAMALRDLVNNYCSLTHDIGGNR